MKPYLLFALALAMAACVTSPKESTPVLKAGLYHEISGPMMKMEIHADHTTYSYHLEADNSKLTVGYGNVYFVGDTIKIVPCATCDTGSFFARNDTLLLIKSSNKAKANDPPLFWYVKE